MTKKLLMAVLATALVAGMAVSANAATKTWNVASGHWNVADNWNAVGVPVATDAVQITGGGTATLDATDGSQQITTMSVGTGATGGILDITGVTLTVTGSNTDIGRLGNGTVNVYSGGTLAAGVNLRLNGVSGGTGTLNVYTGGTVTTGTTFDPGYNTSTNNAYVNINGGTVNVGTNLRGSVSTSGTGIVYITVSNGGALNVNNGAIQLGSVAGSRTELAVSGTTSTVTASSGIDIGRSGVGILGISGGTVTSSGSVRVNAVNTGSDGSALNLSGGALNIIGAGNFSVGQAGAGTVTQTAGTMNLTGSTGGTLYIGGFTASGLTSYAISGGTIRTNNMTIGSSDGASTSTLDIQNSAAVIEIGGASTGTLSLGANSILTAVSGSTIKFVAPTGVINTDVGPPAGPYNGLGVYMYLSSTSESNLAGLGNTNLVFAGGVLPEGFTTGVMEIAGTDLGAVEAGFSGNFNLAGLTVGDGVKIGNVKLVDLFDNGNRSSPEALYVDNLVVTAGSTLDLNSLNLYVKSASIAEGANILNGTVTVVPEPATLALVVLGGMGLIARRKRA